ncbi:MAG: CAP domain-containing protein, partial [Verrucomicrobiota bacterium]
TVGAPIPPPPAPSAAAPIPASAPRPAASPANRTVGKFAASVDLLALAASLAGVVILALELFSKSKG